MTPYRAPPTLARLAPRAPWRRVLLAVLFRGLRRRMRERAVRLATLTHAMRAWQSLGLSEQNALAADAALMGLGTMQMLPDGRMVRHPQASLVYRQQRGRRLV